VFGDSLILGFGIPTNDDLQELPETDYQMLKGTQQKVFLQVMAYFHKLKSYPLDKPNPLHINVLGTAGTGKSFLIWCISTGSAIFIQ
jgi:DNA replication protein DnaC